MHTCARAGVVHAHAGVAVAIVPGRFVDRQIASGVISSKFGALLQSFFLARCEREISSWRQWRARYYPAYSTLKAIHHLVDIFSSRVRRLILSYYHNAIRASIVRRDQCSWRNVREIRRGTPVVAASVTNNVRARVRGPQYFYTPWASSRKSDAGFMEHSLVNR